MVRRDGAGGRAEDRRRRDGAERDVRGRNVCRPRDENHRALPARAGGEHRPEHGLMATSRRINIDLSLVIAALLLSLYGLAIVYSAGKTDVKTPATGAYRSQAVWIVVGIVAAWAV